MTATLIASVPAPSRLRVLPQVTLVCVDTSPRLPWTLQAIESCLARLGFGEVLLFTDAASLRGQVVPSGVRWVPIEPLAGIGAYSEFMLKALAPHVKTSHALIIQWDGFVANADAWNDAFLEHDYIGAPWNHIDAPNSVGNGGFSLRSARLLAALQAKSIVASHPEDLCICQTHRAALEARGIRFAPRHVAESFAVEDGELSARVFGFHGPYHLPSVLQPEQTLALIESLPASIATAHYLGELLRKLTMAADADDRLVPALEALERLVARAVDGMHGEASLGAPSLHLSKALIRHGQYAAADELLRHRRLALGSAWAEPRLRLRLHMHRFLAAVGLRQVRTRSRR
jgi:Protein of unknown function (DUF5672)